MGFRIMQKNELAIENCLKTNRIDTGTENDAVNNSETGLQKMPPEYTLSISEEGFRLANGQSQEGRVLSREELAAMYGEEVVENEETQPIRFKYGYEKEFDAVSADFRKPFNTLYIGAFAECGIDYDNIDYGVVDRMAETYERLKQEIEDSYEGEEKEDRLSELDRAFQTTYKDNIIKPIERQIDNAINNATLLYRRGGLSDSVRFSTQYYKNLEKYQLLEVVNKQFAALAEVNFSKWITDKDYMKDMLKGIVSSLIEITGTPDQKADYVSKNPQ